jgi:hypothetical protein
MGYNTDYYQLGECLKRIQYIGLEAGAVVMGMA